MRKAPTAILLALVIISCASTPTPPASDATATAVIKAIVPQPGSVVVETTVLQAEVHYSIVHFHPQSEYYLAPLFDSTDGAGRTFNEFKRLTDGWKLTQASGSVHIKYPIAREWRSPSLARPIRLTFKVMVRTGAHSTKVIGETESVQFAPVV